MRKFPSELDKNTKREKIEKLVKLEAQRRRYNTQVIWFTDRHQRKRKEDIFNEILEENFSETRDLGFKIERIHQVYPA